MTTAHATQPTSREAYLHDAKPTLGHRQLMVFNEIRKAKNLTNSEIASRLAWPINTVTPRTNELVKMGLVFEDEIRECRVTGRRCIAWYTSQPSLFDEYGLVRE